jgi:formate dehydrogenase
MRVGTVAAGRIGLAVLRRPAPFDVKLHRTDRHRLPEEVEREPVPAFHPPQPAWRRTVTSSACGAPLHPETEGLFGDKPFAA